MTTPPDAKTTETPPPPRPDAPSAPLSSSDGRAPAPDTRNPALDAREPSTDEAARARDTPDAPSLALAWRWWLAPALAAFALALLFADPFAGDWDAVDYTVLALRGEPSTMLFGRILFIFANHLAYRVAHAAFGLEPGDAYLLFKYMVVCETPLVVVALWALARDLTRDARAATVAAWTLAACPFFIIYGGQAMTEIPSLLLVCSALVVHLRGLRRRSVALVILGASLLGACNNVREVASLYGVWLVVAPLSVGWKLDRRALSVTALACVAFFACAFAPFLFFYLGDVGGYRAGWHGWVESMRSEEGAHPVSLRNFAPLFLFFFVAAPLALLLLPAAARAEWRARRFSPPLALACVGVFANLMLVTHYSTVINGRYLLTGLPGVLPLAADYLVRRETKRVGDRRRGFRRAAYASAISALLLGAIFYAGSRETLRHHGITKEYGARLALLPDDAVVIAGGQTVSVSYYRALGAGRWDVIGTGGGFPAAPLSDVIENYLRAGRRVFLDTDSRLWFNDHWRGAETRAVAALGTRFRFRRVSGTVYEIRPAADETARDEPDFERLLRKRPPLLQRIGDWIKAQ
ncbi:MAG: glycosyltransferase family 39 protein [Acidobacteria bacterium]|nr:glycosyltransferase family 39 protein [Acidobacteriota bacterium]MCA1643305.1 glycosyltransferase family 39 protein [Acidobacteriota bacterium]